MVLPQMLTLPLVVGGTILPESDHLNMLTDSLSISLVISVRHDCCQALGAEKEPEGATRPPQSAKTFEARSNVQIQGSIRVSKENHL